MSSEASVASAAAEYDEADEVRHLLYEEHDELNSNRQTSILMVTLWAARSATTSG